MLAEHDRTLPPEFGRIEAFVGRGMFRDAVGVNARLVRKHGAADDALVERNRPARRAFNEPRDAEQRGRVDAGVASQQMPRAHDDLFERGVSGALAEAVDGRVRVGRARALRASVLAVASPRSSCAWISISMSTASRSLAMAS
jgi:hypothetical protein